MSSCSDEQKYGGTFEIRCTLKFGAMSLSRNISRRVTLSGDIFTEIYRRSIFVQNCDRNNELPESKSVKLSQNDRLNVFFPIHFTEKKFFYPFKSNINTRNQSGINAEFVCYNIPKVLSQFTYSESRFFIFCFDR